MRASEYPCPDYACYIWHRGDALMLALPALDDSNGRTLTIPLDKCASSAPGIQFLLGLLAERRRVVSEGKKCLIGTKSEPTAQMLEQAMLASRRIEVSREINEDLFASDATVQQEETQDA